MAAGRGDWGEASLLSFSPSRLPRSLLNKWLGLVHVASLVRELVNTRLLTRPRLPAVWDRNIPDNTWCRFNFLWVSTTLPASFRVILRFLLLVLNKGLLFYLKLYRAIVHCWLKGNKNGYCSMLQLLLHNNLAESWSFHCCRLCHIRSFLLGGLNLPPLSLQLEMGTLREVAYVA